MNDVTPFGLLQYALVNLYADGVKPRVHGNGFVQLDLNNDGTTRLHVWHDDVPRQEVATPVHDHVFDMYSEVILGTLIHDELEPVFNYEDGKYVIYRAERQEGTQNTILVPDEGRVDLVATQHLVMSAGSYYTFPHGKLHTSDHIGLTATVMSKENAPTGYGNPRVLVPYGEEPDNDFHRDAFDSEMLWGFVWRVIEALNV